MRNLVSFVILAVAIVGCAHAVQNPAVPGLPDDEPAGILATDCYTDTRDGLHRLWGEWMLFFNAEHDRVDVVPRRQGRFHLNSTKFLEEYCADCLEITNIRNNGDGTIDLTVRITHPFAGHPEYTGFDVKGIIMFNGSYRLKWDSFSPVWPYGDQFIISWRETGDPEVLNPDGFTPRWSPWWDSGSSMPIFNYWPGKYSRGTPTANINAFLNFYTDEERHMFRVHRYVERTYHIWLPPGPVVAGYAIEACWEPPTVTPVTDPLNDFPISANQVGPYYCRLVVNNDEVITFSPCCGYPGGDCDTFRIVLRKWYGENPQHMGISWPPPYDGTITGGSGIGDCEGDPPAGEHWLSPLHENFTKYEDGYYRGMAVIYTTYPWPKIESVSYDIFEFTIDLD